jgi:VWFA-related protein
MIRRTAGRALLAAALLALVCAVQAAPALGDGEVRVDIVSLDTNEQGDLLAVLSVTDAWGRPVAGLTEANFIARVGDTAGGQGASPSSITRVTSAVNSDIGVGVVLAVDVSGSMEGEPLDQARAAARAFVDGLAPIDSVALVTFSDSATPALNFSADKAAVFAALDSLQALGNTALYQATSVSAFVAASAQTQRKAVILLSDGVDFGNRSAVSRDDSLAHAATIGVPFFVIGLGSEIDRAYLEALAQGTGGRFLETPTPAGLSDLYHAIGDSLRSQYIVTVSPGTLDRTQDQAFEIEVRVGEGSGLASETLPALETPVNAAEPPVVTVQGLTSGAEVDGPVNLSLQASGELPLKTLRVTVDGSLLAQLTSAPYEVSLDPAAYAAGGHVLRVEATDTAGSVGSTELAFVAASPAGGGPSLALLAAGVLLLLLAAAGALGLLAIARRRPGTPEVSTRIRPWSSRHNGDLETPEWTGGDMPAMSDEPLGRLIVAGGPQQGAALDVGSRPRRIGSAPYCDLVLTDDDGAIAPEEARVWVSEGRLLYHKLTRLTAFASDGPSGGWFVLADRDEMRIGPHRLVFELLPQKDVYAEALSVLGKESADQVVGLAPSEEAEQTPATLDDEDIPWRRARESSTDGGEKTPVALEDDIPWRQAQESLSTDNDGEGSAGLDEDIPWRHAQESSTENDEEPSGAARRGAGSRRRRGKKDSTASQAAAWLKGEEQLTVDLQVPDDADLDDEND